MEPGVEKEVAEPVPQEEEGETTLQPTIEPENTGLTKTRDKYNMILIGFGLIACGISLPFKALIGGVSYFQELYVTNNVLFGFGLAYLTFYMFVFVVAIKFSRKYYFSRIIGGCIGLLCLIGIIALTKLYGYALLLIAICLIGAVQAFSESALYGLSGVFPSPKFINGIQIGKAFSGAVIVLLKLSFTASPSSESQIVLGAHLIWACIGLLTAFLYFLFMYCQSYFIYYSHDHQLQDNEERILPPDTDIPLEVTAPEQEEQTKNMNTTRETFVNFFEIYKELFFRTWSPMLACACVFGLTLSLYPGLVSHVTAREESGLNKNGWFVIILIIIFTIFDLFGRLLLREKYFVKIPPKIIYILVSTRLIFYPLWILCVHPRFLSAEVFPVAIMIFFGLSNGFCGTYMLMYGPSLVAPSKRGNATVALAASATVGEFFGFLLGEAFQRI